MFKCNTCGRITDKKPKTCPKCGQKTFTKLSKKDSNMIKKSGLTNEIHMEVLGLLEGLLELSKIGIKEKLDPPCLVIFNKQKSFCEELIPSIKAELETHVKKGKWG